MILSGFLSTFSPLHPPSPSFHGYLWVPSYSSSTAVTVCSQLFRTKKRRTHTTRNCTSSRLCMLIIQVILCRRVSLHISYPSNSANVALRYLNTSPLLLLLPVLRGIFLLRINAHILYIEQQQLSLTLYL